MADEQPELRQRLSAKKEAKSDISSPNKAPPEKPLPPSKLYLPLNTAFYLLVLSRFLAAIYAPIQDCDEVFNYWEPLHYLIHGYGFQTWEYSPEYSIRSWFYIVIHAVPAKLASAFDESKTFQFVFVRSVLGLVAAGTETRLYAVISRSMNPLIGIVYLLIIAFSPGVFSASVALLPSSFAMYANTLALAAFLDRQPKIVVGTVWFGIGAMIGWPFSGILILPFVFEEVIASIVSGRITSNFRLFVRGAVSCLGILALQCAVEAFFYHKLTIVPLRIVLYNVFSGSDQGPNIFGTEPWHFYLRNLLLNFNIWVLFALAAGVLLFLQYILRIPTENKQNPRKTLITIVPFYLWMAIFTLQPHKEERFMYPIYPFLALNAAVALDISLWLGHIGILDISKIPKKIRVAAILAVALLSLQVALLRTVGVVTAYRAPMQVFKKLETESLAAGDTVCLGKEWYRFPSSHFLPNGTRAKFIRSEFSGLLPGEFATSVDGSDPFAGTRLVPPGMNDRNEEDVGKYTNLSDCKYLVEAAMPSTQATELEPDYISQSDNWKKISCEPFLDTMQTSLLARSIWIPDLPFLPSKLRRHWGTYCLLKRHEKPLI